MRRYFGEVRRPHRLFQESEQAPAALKLIERWVEQGRHLEAIARHFRQTKGAPIDLIRSVGQKALDAKDLIAIIEIIAAIVARDATYLVDSIVVPGVRHFTTVGILAGFAQSGLCRNSRRSFNSCRSSSAMSCYRT